MTLTRVDRATIAVMLKAFAEGTLVETLACVISHLQRESDARCAVLQARIAELERRGFTEYKGVWCEGKYQRGSMVTDHGNMWLALTDTDSRPPGGGDWKMTVRAPRVPTVGTRRQHDQHHRG